MLIWTWKVFSLGEDSLTELNCVVHILEESGLRANSGLTGNTFSEYYLNKMDSFISCRNNIICKNVGVLSLHWATVLKCIHF
jgi:hypothetical protein